MTSLTRSELAAYALCAILVALVGARALRAPQGGAPAPHPVAAAAPDGRAPRVEAEGGAGAVVHVVGAVRRPGLYELPAGARVADAVQEAGGATARAELGGLNLAAKVLDAQQVVVPRRGAGGVVAGVPGAGAAPGPEGAAAPAGTPGGAGAPAAPIDLNRATAQELETLDGIGPATAAKILEARTQRGAFRSVDDLAQVPGIGPKRLAALRARVRV